MKKITVIIILISVARAGFSQDTSEEKGSIKIETNPAFWILGGYSVRPSYVFPKRWTIGLQFAAGFKLPGAFRDSFFDDNENVDVHWDFLAGTEARYRFTDAAYDKGFFILAALGYEGWTVQEASTDNEDSFTNWYSAVGVGYNWYPFKRKNFHIGATYNLIVILNNTDERLAGSTPYNIQRTIPPSLVPSSLYLGWTF